MASKIQIVNKAFGLLSTSPISDFSDQTKKAKIAENAYPIIRDRVLEDADWTFATKREILIPNTEKPKWGQEASYQLPNDCIRVFFATQNPTTKRPLDDWTREEQTLTTRQNYPQLYIKYIARIEDTGKFSPYFTDILSLALAAEMAMPITKNRTTMEFYEALYQDRLDTGAAKDGSQGAREEFWSERTIEVR